MIAFGAMSGFTILFLAAMFLLERSSRRVDFPKSDSTETRDDNPFASSD
jgi:hypothetical protein